MPAGRSLSECLPCFFSKFSKSDMHISDQLEIKRENNLMYGMSREGGVQDCWGVWDGSGGLDRKSNGRCEQEK